MNIQTNNNDGTVTITVDRNELATLDYSLGCFQSLALFPRPGHPGDHATKEDVECANTMEQALFTAWCKLDEVVSGYPIDPEDHYEYEDREEVVRFAGRMMDDQDETEALREFHAEWDCSGNE